MMRLGIISMCALLVGLPVHAAKANSLRDHEGVTIGLITAGIVTEIDDNCPTVGVRKLRGLMYLRSLYTMAQDAGFSHDEIEAYVDDKEEEARLRKHVDVWLANRNAKPGDAESYCAIGRDQIDRGTQVGVLLKAE